MQKMTSAELRRKNISSIYNFIYRSGGATRQEIQQQLQLSLPTIAQDLRFLEQEGLVRMSGLSDSRGGRRPQALECDATARYAIGVELLKDTVDLVAIDLFGNRLASRSLRVPYENSRVYQCMLSANVRQLALELALPPERLLGVGIAVQGLVSDDGSRIVYGKVLQNTGTTLNDFAQELSVPAMLIHDAEAAAFAEIWRRSDLKDAIYLGLNRNIGGAVVLDRRILHGDNLRSGAIEHMCLVPNGPQCYCGRRGCMETYCSGERLELASGCSLEAFFDRLRGGSASMRRIWEEYLQHLAFSIDSIRFVLDQTILLGGCIAEQMLPEDMEYIRSHVQEAEMCELRLEKGTVSTYPAATGAALQYIDRFLSSI